jgi:hypothetical protein
MNKPLAPRTIVVVAIVSFLAIATAVLAAVFRFNQIHHNPAANLLLFGIGLNTVYLFYRIASHKTGKYVCRGVVVIVLARAGYDAWEAYVLLDSGAAVNQGYTLILLLSVAMVAVGGLLLGINGNELFKIKCLPRFFALAGLVFLSGETWSLLETVQASEQISWFYWTIGVFVAIGASVCCYVLIRGEKAYENWIHHNKINDELKNKRGQDPPNDI